MFDASIVIPAGNSIEVEVDWFNMAGVAEVPTAVRYQVFDYRTRASVGEAVSLDDLDSEMTFSVPGTRLPGNSGFTRRTLIVKIEGTFLSAEDTHVEEVEVHVSPDFAFT